MKYTNYEKARIVGARALQISMGAPFLIELSKKELEKINYNPLKIALMELERDVIPISIVRPMPKPTQTPERPAALDVSSMIEKEGGKEGVVVAVVQHAEESE